MDTDQLVLLSVIKAAKPNIKNVMSIVLGQLSCKWCSNLFYLTRFLNYESNKSLHHCTYKIIVQRITVHNLKICEWLVFSAKVWRAKKVPVLLVITGGNYRQTQARNISGMQGQIFNFDPFYTFLSAAALSLMWKLIKWCLPPPPPPPSLALTTERSFSGFQDPSMNKKCVLCTIAFQTYFMLHSYHCIGHGNCFECK